MEKGNNKKGFSIYSVLIIAFISALVGLLISVRLDYVQPATAENEPFWQNAATQKNITKEILPQGVPSFVALARDLSPTVVNISTTQIIKQRKGPSFRDPFFDDFFGDEFKKFFDAPKRKQKRQSLGSGFIINKEGYILTNYHVIKNASEIIITLWENKKIEYKAEIIGQDEKLDVALIKIDADIKLPVAPLGDSDAMELGQWVMAIGNPFGLGGTVTAGIVSQKGRVIGAGPYDNFIQTDASINPGNSGGPLFNTQGEVIGMNTAIIAGGQGIGFATPINMIKDVLGQLKDSGKVTRGWIGVSLQDIDKDMAEAFGLKNITGVLITSVVEGDPASIAGMKAGDIILEFNNKKINDLNDLPRAVASTKPGKKAKVLIVRDSKEKTLFIKVAKKKDASGKDEEEDKEIETKDDAKEDKLGLIVEDITDEYKKKLNLKDKKGVIVLGAKEDSFGAESGLRKADVILEINGMEVVDVKTYKQAIKSLKKDSLVRFRVLRGKRTFYIVTRLKD